MKIVCLLADGFEEIEALGTGAILRRSGMQVDYVSVLNVPVVVGSFGTKVIPDQMMKDVSDKEYDGVLIPGGAAAKTLRENAAVMKLVLAFAAKKKLLAAICAGPTVFGVLGLLDGVRYTGFPSTESFMPKGLKVPSASIISGNIITGAGAGTVMEFAFNIISVAFGIEKMKEIKKRMLYREYE
jgi:4-methyl-5(b-hydroxyethyl)-thiazole monophosphate biosynthesis